MPEEELFSSHKEADSRIILHCDHIARNFPATFVIAVRSPDTDVLVLLLKFSKNIDQTILFDTGTGNKSRLLNVKDIVSAKGTDLCEVLPALQFFTGCDTTSAFVRRGKVAPLKVLEKRKYFLSTFRSLGQASEIEETAFNELEQFVCCMYGKPKYSTVNKLRYHLFIQKYQPTSGSLLTSGDGIDLSLLPSCRDSLYMHIKRANYQTLLWNSAQERFPGIPEPIGHGWTTDDKGKLTYDWACGDIMPQELIDIISETELG